MTKQEIISELDLIAEKIKSMKHGTERNLLFERGRLLQNDLRNINQQKK